MELGKRCRDFFENNKVSEAKAIVKRVEVTEANKLYDVGEFRDAKVITLKHKRMRNAYLDFFRELGLSESLLYANLDTYYLLNFDKWKKDSPKMVKTYSDLRTKARACNSLESLVDVLLEGEEKGCHLFSDFLDGMDRNYVAVPTKTSPITGREESPSEKNRRIREILTKHDQKLSKLFHDELKFEDQVIHILDKEIFGGVVNGVAKQGLMSKVDEFTNDPNERKNLKDMLKEIDDAFVTVDEELCKSYYTDADDFQTTLTGATPYKKKLARERKLERGTYEGGRLKPYYKDNGTVVDRTNVKEKDLKKVAVDLSKYAMSIDPESKQKLISLVNKIGALYDLPEEKIDRMSMEQSTKEYSFSKLLVDKDAVEAAVKSGNFNLIKTTWDTYKKTLETYDGFMKETKEVFKNTPKYEVPVNLDTIRNASVPWKYSRDFTTHVRLNFAYQVFVSARKVGVPVEEYIQDPIGSIEKSYQACKKEYGSAALINNANLLAPDVIDRMAAKAIKFEDKANSLNMVTNRGLFGLATMGQETEERKKNRIYSNAYSGFFADRSCKDAARTNRIISALRDPLAPNNKNTFIAIWGANLLGKGEKIKLDIGWDEIDKDGFLTSDDMVRLEDYRSEIDMEKINAKLTQVTDKLDMDKISGHTDHLEYVYGCQAAILEMLKGRASLTDSEERLVQRLDNLTQMVPNKAVKKQMIAAKRAFTEQRKLLDSLRKPEEVKKDAVTYASFMDIPDIMKKKTSNWKTKWSTSPQYDAVVKSMEDVREVVSRIRELGKTKGKDFDELCKQYTRAAGKAYKKCIAYLKNKDNQLKDPNRGNRSSYEEDRVLSVSRLALRLRNEQENREVLNRCLAAEVYKEKLPELLGMQDNNTIFNKKLKSAAIALEETRFRKNRLKWDLESFDDAVFRTMDDPAFKLYVMTRGGNVILSAIQNNTIDADVKEIRERHDYAETDRTSIKDNTVKSYQDIVDAYGTGKQEIKKKRLQPGKNIVKFKNRIFGEDEKSQGSASSRKIIFNINGNSQKNNSNFNKVKSK